MLAGLLRVLVVGLVALVAVQLMIPRPRPAAPGATTRVAAPAPLPRGSLVAADGTPLELGEPGRLTLLVLGDTRCTECAATLATVAAARAQLGAAGAAGAPAIVFASIDPERDTPARIDSYVARFAADIVTATVPRARRDALLAALAAASGRASGGSLEDGRAAPAYVLAGDGRVIAAARAPRDAAALGAELVELGRRAPSAPTSAR